jgi:hypothetical protein
MDWELAPKTAIVSNSVSKTLKVEHSSPYHRKAVANIPVVMLAVYQRGS